LSHHKFVCHITFTTEDTHEIIRAILRAHRCTPARSVARARVTVPRSRIRWCGLCGPDRAPGVLEPEGLDDDTIYPNGVSSSLPAEVQLAFLRTMPGLERVRHQAAGLAIEYDHVDPRELLPTLETKRLPALFLAGQINGTNGYEEAGAQGVAAGSMRR